MTAFTKLFRLAKNITKSAGRSPKDLSHIFGIALKASEDIANPASDVRDIPSIDVIDLFDGANGSRLSLLPFPQVPASISLVEAAALVGLMFKCHATTVFEFGTYKGVSTTQLALNLPLDGRVYTLDLPEDDPNYSLGIDKKEEREIAEQGGKGILIPEDLVGKVTFLKSDSARFDQSPYIDQIDFAFVDGAHNYVYVKSDSEKAWSMLRSGGIIAWHDCIPSHRDVVRFVKECGWNAKMISGTSLAFAIKS